MITTNFFCILVYFCEIVQSSYVTERQKLLKQDLINYIGFNDTLTDFEHRLNNHLMKLKLQELNIGFRDSTKFGPIQHWFKCRNNIKKSKVYDFIKRMPKGALLHSHDTAQLPPEWFMNLFRLHKKYIYFFLTSGKNGLEYQYKLTNKPEKGWLRIDDFKSLLRQKYNVTNFEKDLSSRFTLIRDQPYPSVEAVWRKFDDIFNVIRPMVKTKEIYKQYLREVLNRYYKDNVMYIEFRSSLHLNNFDGTPLLHKDVMSIIRQISDEFIKTHKNFIGIKVIFAYYRNIDVEYCKSLLDTYHKLKELFKDYILGFDLVGYESEKPLKYFKHILEPYKENTTYFFHAGETNWNGMKTDENLIDAILLDTKRIGHGYAVIKHPKVLNEIKKRAIAIEISPISNQVLMLTQDFRNHPASYYFANNYPVVITNDDPGFWGAEGLTDDFYIVFMAIAHSKADLKFLKRLIVNSIMYSGLLEWQKIPVLKLLLLQWERFVEEMISYYDL